MFKPNEGIAIKKKTKKTTGACRGRLRHLFKHFSTSKMIIVTSVLKLGKWLISRFPNRVYLENFRKKIEAE